MHLKQTCKSGERFYWLFGFEKKDKKKKEGLIKKKLCRAD